MSKQASKRPTPAEVLDLAIVELLRMELPLVSADSGTVLALAGNACTMAQNIGQATAWLEPGPAEQREIARTLALTAMHIVKRLARGDMEPQDTQIVTHRLTTLLATATVHIDKIWVPGDDE